MMASDEASESEIKEGNAPYKIHYFDHFNRGEPIRMALWYANVPHEDNRMPFDNWAELKPKLPFVQLPALELPNG